MRLVIVAVIGMALGVLASCAALGLATPQTLDQKIEYGYAGVDAVLKAIPPGLAAGSLGVTSATAANTMALNVKGILDGARLIEATNPAGAQQDLALATQTLTAVQRYLTQHGVHTP